MVRDGRDRGVRSWVKEIEEWGQGRGMGDRIERLRGHGTRGSWFVETERWGQRLEG